VVLVGACFGSLGGFCAVLYVENDGNSLILCESRGLKAAKVRQQKRVVLMDCS